MAINENLQMSLKQEQGNATKGCLKKICINVPDCFELEKHEKMLNENQSNPDTVHENLWEHFKLNMNYGLFRVNEATNDEQPVAGSCYAVKQGDIFQIRGHDLANMTLVFDGSGWIVMDVLTTSEIATVVWEGIVKEYLNTAKINAIIYSHTHVDHYGGVSGLYKFFADECKIYAPKGFTEHAVSENIYVGTAMSRRGMYQYGTNLSVGVTGHVDCGLGTLLSKGINSIIKPHYYVSHTEIVDDSHRIAENSRGCEVTIGGVTLQFQYTPGTEAPAEMNAYIVESNVLFIAENCCGTLHNILTPRGALVRDPLAWANYLDQTLKMFPDVKVLCSSHNWPRFGNNEYKRYIELQMDMYRFINNATLHLINLGYTIDEVGRMIEKEVPEIIDIDWCCRGFYGTYNHNAKAVYQRYIGWYDGNPSHLNRLSPSDRADRFVKAFEKGDIYQAADDAFKIKDYAWATELYDHIFNAATADKGKLDTAKENYAECLRQLGYASEAATWRNMYLTAAQEVKTPLVLPQTHKYLTFAEETINAMTLDMILQYLSITLNFKRSAAEGINSLLLAVILDEKESALVWQRNSVLYHSIMPKDEVKRHRDEAEYLVQGTKIDFFKAFIEHDTDAIKTVTNKSKGKTEPAEYIKSMFTRFALDFPIMTPRKALV
ncbi:MAG: MBL fold metallo-hydrolase [Defluviitaleaceae bacterium]|nr:MBL fold metallo-hydrolase [Defluviitaleaceae bacterium]